MSREAKRFATLFLPTISGYRYTKKNLLQLVVKDSEKYKIRDTRNGRSIFYEEGLLKWVEFGPVLVEKTVEEFWSETKEPYYKRHLFIMKRNRYDSGTKKELGVKT